MCPQLILDFGPNNSNQRDVLRSFSQRCGVSRIDQLTTRNGEGRASVIGRAPVPFAFVTEHSGARGARSGLRFTGCFLKVLFE